MRFGLAGWSYPDWRGVVYPKGCKDTLRAVARHVDLIEINSTFYRLPDPAQCGAWVRRTEDLGTLFSAKVPQEVSHGGASDPDLLARICGGFEPLAASGRLRTLLLQFSYRFENTQHNRRWLGAVLAGLAPVAPITVEVRHQSWGQRSALAALEDLGVAVAQLDYPGATTGFGVRDTHVHGPMSTAYFRLHGRNRHAWFKKGAGRDQVYDHEYDDVEQQELRDRLLEIATGARETLVVANNHFHGKAMKVMLQLMAWYRGARVEVPEGMLSRFPDLAAVARSRTLFD